MTATTRPTLQPVSTLFWLVCSLAAAAALGALAYVIKPWFDPLVIQPIALGLGCGLAFTLAMWLLNVGYRPALVAGSILATMAAVLLEHYTGYLIYLNEYANKTSDLGGLVAFNRADNFVSYLARFTDYGVVVFGYRLFGWMVWTYWAAEWLLVAGGALAVVWPLSRQSYCADCNSWYRVVRQGSVPQDAVRTLAKTYSLPSHRIALKYKLYACRTGCGKPAVELFWPATASTGEGRKAVWLEDAQYRELTDLLNVRGSSTVDSSQQT